jgi:hypothetical protein
MNANHLFWRLPVRCQILVVRALVWFHARVPHEHCWMGTEGWSHETGWVRHDDYCAICGKRREHP